MTKINVNYVECDEFKSTFDLTVGGVNYVSINQRVDLFDYVTNLNGERVSIETKDRINFLWKIEEGKGLVQLSLSGKFTCKKEGIVRLKLLHKFHSKWYCLGSVEFRVVNVILPELEAEVQYNPCKFIGIEKPNGTNGKDLFDTFICTFTNKSEISISVWQNLNVKLNDWKIFWEPNMKDKTIIAPGQKVSITFSQERDILNLYDVKIVSYTLDYGNKTIAVFWDTDTGKTTFSVVKLKD